MAFSNYRAFARDEPLPFRGKRIAAKLPTRTIPTFAEALEAYIKLQATGMEARQPHGARQPRRRHPVRRPARLASH